MASYGTSSAPLQDKHAQLVANTVDTVYINSYGLIEIVNETGTDKIYVEVGEVGSNPPAPTVGGDNTYEVSAVAGESLEIPTSIGKTFVVQLISATAENYSVMSKLNPEQSS